METLIAPFAVRPSDTTELQPDVLVERDEDFTVDGAGVHHQWMPAPLSYARHATRRHNI